MPTRDLFYQAARRAYREIPPDESLRLCGIEEELILNFRLAVLEACHWHRAYAAEVLGISVRALTIFLMRCKELGFEIPRGYKARTAMSERDERFLKKWIRKKKESKE